MPWSRLHEWFKEPPVRWILPGLLFLVNCSSFPPSCEPGTSFLLAPLGFTKMPHLNLDWLPAKDRLLPNFLHLASISRLKHQTGPRASHIATFLCPTLHTQNASRAYLIRPAMGHDPGVPGRRERPKNMWRPTQSLSQVPEKEKKISHKWCRAPSMPIPIPDRLDLSKQIFPPPGMSMHTPWVVYVRCGVGPVSGSINWQRQCQRIKRWVTL
ncbi:hypothetical protein QBC32DRAFT_29389 [Pseudoneurospora amorphoporcata]|uniref:Uncharacterized protein n=1 Tax=Pseudoneurospora amorphoporcata TaxID=241081 RepID=A0AAN6SJI8_9PEZI|nr:hypothetical protein QBC32DRAFT_29389 [Pseudoneurospora amorphoporcata]